MFASADVEAVLASDPDDYRLPVLLAFLASHPDLTPKPRGKKTAGSRAHLESLVASYANGRNAAMPKLPDTKVYPAVLDVLEACLGYTAKSAFENHRYGMAAENFVGTILEEYLASILEPQGWVWCAGSSVKSVDFVKQGADTPVNCG